MAVFSLSGNISRVAHWLNLNTVWDFHLDVPILISFEEMSEAFSCQGCLGIG